LIPVIRSGDRLIVEEHTARVDAVLEARAMNPAAVGGALDVRLTIGGVVVRAVALGPGRAAFQTGSGVRP
jgi:flagella basal body P-ring formation protein FlgA